MKPKKPILYLTILLALAMSIQLVSGAASFQVSSFSCTPAEVAINGVFSCTAQVQNAGDIAGSVSVATLYPDANDWLEDANYPQASGTSVDPGQSVEATFSGLRGVKSGESGFSKIMLDDVTDTYVADNNIEENVIDVVVISSSSTSSVAAGGSFDITAEVTAGGNIDVTLTFSDGSGTCDIGNQASQKSITGMQHGNKQSRTWSITQGTSGDCEYTISAAATGAGGIASKTDSSSGSVTCTDCSNGGGDDTPASSGGGGGGGGGGASTELKEKTQLWSQVQANTLTTMKPNSSLIPITQISFELKETANDVSLTVKALDEKPSALDAPSDLETYKYLELTTANIETSNLKSSPKIKFEVAKSWVEDNYIKTSTITMLRYSADEWNDLEASQTSSDTNKYYFEASTPGFSYFAITGVKKTAEEIAAEAKKSKEEFAAEIAEKLRAIGGSKWIIIIGVIVVVLIVAGLLYKKRKNKINN